MFKGYQYYTMVYMYVIIRFRYLQWPMDGIQRWTSVVLTAGAWLAKRWNTTLIQ